MNSNWFKIFLKMTKVSYGKNLSLKGLPVIFKKNGATLKIGNNVRIRSSFFSNLAGLYSRSIIVARTPEAEIKIGNYVGISGATIYARKGISIGDNTIIGANSKILDNDFHPIDAEQRRKQIYHITEDEIKIPTKEIIIGSDCFIGCNTIILKGTVLGNGCVVGAGAVVSGKFDDRSLIVGNPARVIKILD